MMIKPKSIRTTFLEVDALPEQKQIINPFLHTGTTTMIYAPTGHGKSLFCYHLALEIAQGGEWLGEKATASKVLYIDGELGRRQFIKRFPQCVRFSPQLEENLQILFYEQFSDGSLPNMANVDTHEYWLALAEPYEVIIIDNYQCAAWRTGKIFSDEDIWMQTQKLLQAFKMSNKATLLVHHTNKTGDQHGTVKKENHVDTDIMLRQFPVQSAHSGVTLELQIKKDRNNFFDNYKELLFEMVLDEYGTKTIVRDIHRARRNYIRDKLKFGVTITEIATDLKIPIGYAKELKYAVDKEYKQDEMGIYA